MILYGMILYFDFSEHKNSNLAGHTPKRLDAFGKIISPNVNRFYCAINILCATGGQLGFGI